MVETKIVKCPVCGSETEIGKLVRRKFCQCGRLMMEVAE